jgi:hypothetical protein
MIVQKGWRLHTLSRISYRNVSNGCLVFLPSEAPASKNLAEFKPRQPASPPIISQLCEPLSQPATLSDTMR